MRALLCVLILALLAGCALGDLPSVGDEVSITQSVGIMERVTEGRVVALENGLITLNVSDVYQRTGFLDWQEVISRAEPHEITIALPTIISMFVLDPLLIPADTRSL